METITDQKQKQPISERKLAANRANAQKSTGPKKPAAKAKISQNAIKFGFYAQGVVLASENLKDYENLRDHLWNQLRPRNPLEEITVREIVDTHWRLQRLAYAETTVFTRRSVSFTGQDCGPGFAFVNDVQGFNTFSSLARVDAMLTRRLYRAIGELRKLREDGWPAPRPEAAAGSETAGPSAGLAEPGPAAPSAEEVSTFPANAFAQSATSEPEIVQAGPESKSPLPPASSTEASPEVHSCLNPQPETLLGT